MSPPLLCPCPAVFLARVERYVFEGARERGLGLHHLFPSFLLLGMAYQYAKLFDTGPSGESHTKPSRPLPVSGEQIINVASATEAYNRLLSEASVTRHLYETVNKLPAAPSYEIDTEVTKARIEMDRLDPGECAFFYISKEDQVGAKRNYDEHPSDPNSRVMSHVAYLNRGTYIPGDPATFDESIKAAIAPIGTVKSPGSEHEPDQHSTVDHAGTIARRNTIGRTITAGTWTRWGIAEPSELQGQSGQESHSKGTRPVLQLYPIDDPKQTDARYFPLVRALAEHFITHVNANGGANDPPPSLSIQQIADNVYLTTNMPKPLYVKGIYDQLLAIAHLGSMAAQAIGAWPPAAGAGAGAAPRAPAAGATRTIFLNMLYAARDVDPLMVEPWLELQLASRDGTMAADQLNGGLCVINAPQEGDLILLPMSH
jgi:hypothetical protein